MRFLIISCSSILLLVGFSSFCVAGDKEDLLNLFSDKENHLMLNDYVWERVSTHAEVHCNNVIIVGENSEARIRYKRSILNKIFAERVASNGFYFSDDSVLDGKYLLLSVYEQSMFLNKYSEDIFAEENCQATVIRIDGDVFYSNDHALIEKIPSLGYSVKIMMKEPGAPPFTYPHQQ